MPTLVDRQHFRPFTLRPPMQPGSSPLQRTPGLQGDMFLFVLACFAPLRLAPWNTVSTEVQLFTPSVIPQGESSSLSSLCAMRFAVLSLCKSAVNFLSL